MHRKLLILCTIFGLVFFSTNSTFALENESSIGELELSNSDQKHLAILTDTQITGSVNGMIASITVSQTFKNQSDDWVNGRYVFPLSEGAAVDSLRIKIGERIIDGIVQEKETAKKIFEQAKQDGKKAGLLEQHRPNLFSISVANIAPHENITATITYIERVRYENNEFSLRLPTTLTPRYIPGAPIKLSSEIEESIQQQLGNQTNDEIISTNGWAANSTSVPDANHITPIQIRPQNDQTTHLFSLKLSLSAGLALQSIDSDSHAISISNHHGQRSEITLSNNTEPLDRDLVLSWRTRQGESPKAAFFQQNFEGDFYSMLMVNPPSVDAMLSIPRDVTFIIDSSGSMSGTSMTQAKQALRQGLTYLSSYDVFNIVDFDSQFRPLFRQSQAANSRSIRQAKNMIKGLHADGGTEMTGALQFALGANQDQSYLKQIVFITDGAIGNEEELFALIEDKLGDTRLFTVGIGSAPNSYFMNRAAKFGRGSYTYINDLNQVTEKMDDLFKKITHPVLRDIKINWPISVEQYPERIPDLYTGEPIMVMAKSTKPLDKIEVSGNLLQTPWEQSISLSNSIQSNTENLDAVWAREKVADLTDKLLIGQIDKETAQPQIIDLGINHNIVTKFTSFVAVDTTPSKPDTLDATHKNIPNLMPQGSTMAIPQTATPATLLRLFGILLITLGWGLNYLFRKANSKKAINAAAPQS